MICYILEHCLTLYPALLWYDFALTLPTELRCVWKNKISGASISYLLIRYTLVVERIVVILKFLWSSSDTVHL